MRINRSVRIHLLWFIGIYFVVHTAVFAQDQITFRQLSVKEGLSQNSAISIAQDSIGNLWIATQDGLNKYDGRTFTTYPFQFLDITRPNYSTLGQIYVDNQQQLWIIPDDKVLYKFNYEKDSFIELSGITDAYTMLQDSNLNYWVTTFTNQLFFIDGTSMKVTQVPLSQLLKSRINKIEQITNQTITLLGNGELIEIDINTKKNAFYTLETTKRKMLFDNLSTIITDKNGRIFIGTYGNGIFIQDTSKGLLKRISEIGFSDDLPNNLNILDVHIDSKNRLWIATYGAGVYLLDLEAKYIRHFISEKQNPRALHYNDILCIYEDYLGTIWLGTDGAGLSYYDENLEKFNSFTNNQTTDSINIDVIRAIGVDDFKNIWIGTSGKGLSKFSNKLDSWKNLSTENSSIPSNRIVSLMPNGKDLWIGTQGEGLSILHEDGSFINFNENTRTKLSARTIWDIFKDSKDQLWLATRDNGLILFDENQGEIRKFMSDTLDVNQLPTANIRVVTEDNKQNLWLGTNSEGLIKLNPENGISKTYLTDPLKNSITNNTIKSLFFAPNEILWIGTGGGGLNAFDIKTETFYSYTTHEGLSNNVIYAVLPDDKGTLWLSSNKGITNFIPGHTFDNTPVITNYTNYDGLATEFNTGAYWKDTTGDLYFGGLDGFYWFKPEAIKKNNILPKTAITSLEILNETYPLKKDMRLDHDQNTIAFTFSSMQFSLPKKNKYKYKLVNYDEDWVDAGNNNYVRYTRLSPGHYTFQVKSSNYDGVWNEVSEHYSFSIKPPWYFNQFTKILYLFLLLATAFGIYKYLNWRLTMKLHLQHQEEEASRLQKLNDFRSKLYTNIAHEFKTPLTLISGPIDRQLTKEGLSDFDYSNLSMVKRNTYRMTSLVDQLLQLSKLEEGKLKKNIQKADLGLFLHMISKSFEYQASLKDIKYDIDIDSTGMLCYDEDIIEKIISNLLSNAFKYTPEKGDCKFEAKYSENTISVAVQNTIHKGSEVQPEKFFKRFYQFDEYNEGIGVGLSLVKELVVFYKGTISASVEEGNTILFTVTLPVTKDEFHIKDFDITTNSTSIDKMPNDKNTADKKINKADKELPILLLVEDHTEIRSFIKLSFEHKYHIIEAENGQSGIEKAMKTIPDLIISDIRMPKLNGIQLCNALKEDERTSHIPIILLTANDTQEIELKALTSGADDFISKPFKIQLLEKRVSNLISLRSTLRIRYSQELILKPKNIVLSSTDELFFTKIQRILDDHLSETSFNASDFSKKAHMSRMQLHRKLLAFTGLSTTAFIRSQRLKEAKKLLEESDVTINEIAFAVGFSTPSYFMKSFKETFGKTPTEYVASVKK